MRMAHTPPLRLITESARCKVPCLLVSFPAADAEASDYYVEESKWMVKNRQGVRDTHRFALVRDAGNRVPGWEELFYDLIFVATVRHVGHLYTPEPTWEHIGQFAFEFFVIWMVWLQTTLALNRFDQDDITTKVTEALHSDGRCLFCLRRWA